MDDLKKVELIKKTVIDDKEEYEKRLSPEIVQDIMDGTEEFLKLRQRHALYESIMVDARLEMELIEKKMTDIVKDISRYLSARYM